MKEAHVDLLADLVAKEQKALVAIKENAETKENAGTVDPAETKESVVQEGLAAL